MCEFKQNYKDKLFVIEKNENLLFLIGYVKRCKLGCTLRYLETLKYPKDKLKVHKSYAFFRVLKHTHGTVQELY